MVMVAAKALFPEVVEPVRSDSRRDRQMSHIMRGMFFAWIFTLASGNQTLVVVY